MIEEGALVGGVERREIAIADYDPAWPARFERERRAIEAALGAQRAVAIEHVGSTAVPGLGAKPIVDVLVTVADPEESSLADAMARAGYELRVREPGHRMFRTPARDVHVHVLAATDAEVGRMLRFRDRLRADDKDRAAYEALKRSLAAREWRDMNEYAEAKGPLIEEIMARAG